MNSRSGIIRATAVSLTLCAALLMPASGAGAGAAAAASIAVTEKTFGCIMQMQPVRGFYVNNLLGNQAATLAVARSTKEGVYPAGSMVQLIPTEVMIKQPKGFNPATRDWEFFELDVSASGTKIMKRGFADVVNRFGGNCFGCHVKARPEWDMVCETGHGCDPIPLTAAMFRALQRTDPRCPNATQVSAEDAKALQALADLSKPPAAAPR